MLMGVLSRRRKKENAELYLINRIINPVWPLTQSHNSHIPIALRAVAFQARVRRRRASGFGLEMRPD
jgi:hypothetical protein